MASTDARPVAQKNVAYRVTFPILDADGDLVTAAGSLDSEISKDGGTFADCTNEATEIATSSGMYFLDLTSTEMNADTVAIIVKSTGGKTTPIVIYPEEAGDIRVNVTQVAGTTQTAGDIMADTNDIQARLPAALVSGRMDSSVGAMAANVLTATAINADALTAAKFAADVTTEIQTGLATAAELAKVPKSDGTVVWNATAAAQLQSEANDALVAYDPPTGAELVSEINAVQADIAALNNPSAAVIADAVWDEDATGHQTQGTFGQAIGDPVADTNTIFKATVTDAAGATVGVDVVAVKAETAAIVADTNELQTDWVNGGRLDLILDARSSQTSVDDLPTNAELATALGTADDAVLTAIDALPTNAELATALATADDATLAAIAALNNPSAAGIADAVWDEAIAGHLGVGSTGEALNAAGSAGDPWTTALPGAYGAGSAGKILGDNINATISSRATQTSVDDVPTNAELTTALAGADDATLAAIAALNNPSAATIADAVWDEDATAHQTQGTFGQAIGDPGTDADTIWALANTNLNATVSSRASQTSVDDLPTNAELTTALGTADDAVLAAIATVQTDTDNIQTRIPAALVGGRIDASVGAMAADTVTASAIATDAIGSNELAATAITEIQAGLATQVSVDDLPTNAELTTALGTADDATLAAIAALNNLSSAQAQTAAAAALTAYDPPTRAEATSDKAEIIVEVNANETKIDTLDTVADAIKAKTDSLAFTVAGQVDANIQYVNGIEVTGNGDPGTEWGPI